ncbi:hypothetical protein P9X10_02740 [Bacillus cereus]|nr:hypothetical protein [Bacillus cereus]
MKEITEVVVTDLLKNYRNDFRRVKVELQLEEYEQADYIPLEKLLHISGDYGLSLITKYIEKGISFTEITNKTGIQNKLLMNYCERKFTKEVMKDYHNKVEANRIKDIANGKNVRGLVQDPKDIPLYLSSCVSTKQPNREIKRLEEVRDLVLSLLKYGLTTRGICRNLGVVDGDRTKMKLKQDEVKVDIEFAESIWKSIYTQTYNDPDFLYETLERYDKFTLTEELRKHLHFQIKDRNKKINLYLRGKEETVGRNRRLQNKKPVIV